MADVDVSFCNELPSITISNQFLDQAGAVAAFVLALADALGSDLASNLIDVLIDQIESELKDTLTDMVTSIFGQYATWNGFPNPVAVIPIPDGVIRAIETAAGVVDQAKDIIAETEATVEEIDTLISDLVAQGQMTVSQAEQLLGELVDEALLPVQEVEALVASVTQAATELANNLIAMGMMTIAEAQAEFIQKLLDSLSSTPVGTALTNVIDSLIRAQEIFSQIEALVQSVADSLSFSAYVSWSLPELPLPFIEIPTFEVSVAVPCPTDGNLEITAELGTMAQFQSNLMAPKLYDVIPPIKTALTSAIDSVIPGIIDSVVGGLPPMPE